MPCHEYVVHGDGGLKNVAIRGHATVGDILPQAVLAHGHGPAPSAGFMARLQTVRGLVLSRCTPLAEISPGTELQLIVRTKGVSAAGCGCNVRLCCE